MSGRIVGSAILMLRHMQGICLLLQHKWSHTRSCLQSEQSSSLRETNDASKQGIRLSGRHASEDTGFTGDCLPALSADLPSCKAAVAVRLNAKKTKCMPTPAAKTPSRDVTLIATPDMTALLICIQGTNMSSIELSTDMRFLLLSTSFATAAAAAAACQLCASNSCFTLMSDLY
jgi:hypothetical protein